MRWMVVFTLLLTGCAARQGYRFTTINGVPAIAPPGYRDADRQVRVRVPGVLVDGAAARAECSLKSPEFQLQPQAAAGAVVAVVDLEALVPGGAYDQVARETFDRFKIALEALEEGRRCLTSGASELLATRVSESLPMPFQDVPFYRNGYDAFRASVELRPGMRFSQQAAKEDSSRPADTDVVFYQVGTGANGNSTDLKLSGPRAGGAVMAPRKMPHYRLFLRTRFLNEPGNRPERNAVLLGGPDLATLFAATPRLLADPETVCAPSAEALTCAVFPHRFTVSPEVPLVVQGKAQYIDVVGSLAQLLRWQKPAPPKDVYRRVRIRRLYAGKLVKVDLKGAGPLVQKFPLAAGDEVRW